VYADIDQRKSQNASDAISAPAKVVTIAVNHLDERASYKKLLEDLSLLSTSKNLSQEERARIRPRVRKEARTLVTYPVASHVEAIEGILMQRFFGNSRTSVRRRYRRRDDPWSSTQPMGNGASRLLGTPELLEAILSHLPAFNLISLTRVSKTFRQLIHNSPTLLRNLFLLSRKTPFETRSLANHYEMSSDNRSEQEKDYNIALLCPLLHMEWQSYTTFQERFESKRYEVTAIHEWAAYADSFTHMYLTNPPCVEVEFELVYTGIELGNRYPFLFEDEVPDTDHFIRATRKIRNETGVTFAMLMEAAHVKGPVSIITKERLDETRNRRTPEEDGGTPQSDEGTLEEDYERWIETRVVENTTLHDETRAWEEKYSSWMSLDLAFTEVKLRGVIVRTPADFAAIEKADRDAKMEEEQRKAFQAVVLEFKQNIADRSGKPCEIVGDIEEY